jgi:hypothetical protein
LPAGPPMSNGCRTRRPSTHYGFNKVELTTRVERLRAIA